MTWSHSTFADLIAQDYDQLEVFCANPKCRGITVLKLDRIAKYWRKDETVAAIAARLRCAVCNQRPDPRMVKPSRSANAPGAGRHM
ncbi:hypothetical protein SAMN05519103_08503 [Rhizobiales bacterium GAS113]|nr:hypothetical protein SAMN05519103_08503 [Rhizobiales bacterium GAS113]